MSKRPANSRNTLLDVAHDLSLAACFGGTLFGKVVFNPSLPAIYSETERGRLGGAFWNSANPINAAAFGVALLTWLPYRLAPSRVVADRRTRALLLAKDALMVAAGSAGAAAVAAQVFVNRRTPDGVVPLRSGGVPAPGADRTTAVAQRSLGALGGVNAALFAGLVAVTAALREG